VKLEDQLAMKQLVVFLGTGGVGKTTVAAAAAYHASQGRKTLVLTIDPARRLADALGVKLGSEPVEVTPNFHAQMLDTKAALDKLITRYAPSPEVLRRIFASKFYQQLSDAFAGSEEFVAMGTLHDILQDGKYDLVVVDTPPSKHAVDFLATNAKLIRVFESGLVKYLFKPTKFLRLGSGYLANVLARWTSQEYLKEVADFMGTFDQMFLDMEKRVRAMQAILVDRQRTSLNIVTSAEYESIPMTQGLYNEVTKELKLRVDACIVNRYLPRLKGMEAVVDLREDKAFRQGAVRRVTEATGANAEDAEAFILDAVRAAQFYEVLATQHETNVRALQASVSAEFHFIPALPHSVHTLEGLRAISEHLLGRPGARSGSVPASANP